VDHREAEHFEDRQRKLESDVALTAAAARRQVQLLERIELHARWLVLIAAVVGAGWMLSLLQ
jgi:hypothetical protein